MDTEMSIDLNSPEMVSYMSPHAEWKRELIRTLGRRFSLPAFIETGTCWGTTVGAVIGTFKEIRSVEVEESFHKFAYKKYCAEPSVRLYFGSSSELLPYMIEDTPSRPILFWLDAHITGGTTINLGDQVASELAIIDRLAPDSLVLIDDVKPNENGDGFVGPDAPINPPLGWQAFFYSGVLALHKGGYNLPARF